MKLTFTERDWADYLHWLETIKQMTRRVNQLLKDVQRHPFEGIGKPEPLKHLLSGAWSRRIDDEHRLVYLVRQADVELISLRYHY